MTDQRRNKDTGGVPPGTNGTGGSYAAKVQAIPDNTDLTSGKRVPSPDEFDRYIGMDGHYVDESTFDHKDMRDHDLNGLDFTDQSMNGAILNEKRIVGTTFKNARLHEASMRSVTLKKCDLSGARISDVYLGYGFWADTDLSGVQLERSAVEGRWADMEAENMYIGECDLRRLVVASTNMRNASIHSTNLSDASFSHVNLHGALITDGKPAVVMGEGGRYSGVDHTTMARTHFTHCDLRQAGISDTIAPEVTFNRCNLSNAAINYGTFNDARFRDTELQNTEFYKTDLSDAKFTGCEIRSGRFENCTFTDPNTFEGSTLTGTKFILERTPAHEALAVNVEAAGAHVKFI